MLASDEKLSPTDLLVDGDSLSWIENAEAIRRVEKSGVAMPETVLAGWGVSHLVASGDALYFTTFDGKVAKLAKPPPRGTNVHVP